MELPDLRALWSIVATHLWQCTLVLGLIFALATLMRRAPARLVHLLWMAALCKILLPLPLFGGMSLGLLDRLFPWRGSAGADPAAGLPAGLEGLLSPEILVVRPEGGSPAGDPSAVLTLLWLCGAAVIASVWMRSALRARRAAAPAVALPEDLATKLVLALDGTAIPAERVVPTAGHVSPSVAGFWRARILLPSVLVERLDVPELRAILLHEEAHRRRRDPLSGLLQRVAILGFYYYPLLWPVLRRLRSSTEIACDEHVLAHAVPRQTYARALARTVSIGLDPAPGLAAEGHSRSLLQTRFHRITEHGRYVAMPRHLLFLAAAFLAVVVVSFFPTSSMTSAGVTAGAADLTFIELERLGTRDLEVMANFQQTSVERILTAFSSVAGFELQYEGPVPIQPIDLDLARAPLKRALQELSRRSGIRYRVPNPETLVVVVPDSAPAAGSAGEAGRVVLIGGKDGITTPELIVASKVKPDYPEAAKEARLEGKVILQAIVSADGSVAEIEVLRSSQPGQGFEEAALEAVKQWRYQPAMHHGQPVDVYMMVVVEFALN